MGEKGRALGGASSRGVNWMVASFRDGGQSPKRNPFHNSLAAENRQLRSRKLLTEGKNQSSQTARRSNRPDINDSAVFMDKKPAVRVAGCAGLARDHRGSSSRGNVERRNALRTRNSKSARQS